MLFRSAEIVEGFTIVFYFYVNKHISIWIKHLKIQFGFEPRKVKLHDPQKHSPKSSPESEKSFLPICKCAYFFFSDISGPCTFIDLTLTMGVSNFQKLSLMLQKSIDQMLAKHQLPLHHLKQSKNPLQGIQCHPAESGWSPFLKAFLKVSQVNVLQCNLVYIWC